MKIKYLFIAGVVIVVLGVWAGVTLFRRPFVGMVIQSPDKAHGFTLNAADGKTVSLSDYRGKLVMLYFGYTFCPDVCPATLANTGKALKLLGNKADEVQLIMVSVDPARDSPEKLAEYVAHFHPSFIGVTGEPEQIAELAALYGIFFEKHEGTEATGYLVDHTATITVIDKEGYLKLVLPFGVTAEEIANDLRNLLR